MFETPPVPLFAPTPQETFRSSQPYSELRKPVYSAEQSDRSFSSTDPIDCSRRRASKCGTATTISICRVSDRKVDGQMMWLTLAFAIVSLRQGHAIK